MHKVRIRCWSFRKPSTLARFRCVARSYSSWRQRDHALAIFALRAKHEFVFLPAADEGPKRVIEFKEKGKMTKKKKKRQTHLESSSYQENISIENARAKTPSRMRILNYRFSIFDIYTLILWRNMIELKYKELDA